VEALSTGRPFMEGAPRVCIRSQMIMIT
jgi:hypothetical protein